MLDSAEEHTSVVHSHLEVSSFLLLFYDLFWAFNTRLDSYSRTCNTN